MDIFLENSLLLQLKNAGITKPIITCVNFLKNFPTSSVEGSIDLPMDGSLTGQFFIPVQDFSSLVQLVSRYGCKVLKVTTSMTANHNPLLIMSSLRLLTG
jgi:hypothetical protein